MASTGLDGRPILILDEREAKCIVLMFENLEHMGYTSDNPGYVAFREKVINFNHEAASWVTKPTFAELMAEPTELQKLLSPELPRPTGDSPPMDPLASMDSNPPSPRLL